MLVKIFGVMTLACCPLLIFYHLKNAEEEGTGWAKLSLGSFSFNKVSCAFSPILLGILNLNCAQGQITQLFDNGFGINSYDLKIRNACLVN